MEEEKKKRLKSRLEILLKRLDEQQEYIEELKCEVVDIIDDI